MEKFKLNKDTINAILQYLSTKPYIETAPLISEIQKEIEEQSKQKEVEEIGEAPKGNGKRKITEKK